MSPATARWVGLGCTIAGAAASFGVACFSQAGAVTSTVASVAKQGGQAATIVGGAAAVGAGAAEVVVAVKQRDIDKLDAGALAAAQSAARFQSMVAALIEELRGDREDDARAERGYADVIETRDAAALAAVHVRV